MDKSLLQKLGKTTRYQENGRDDATYVLVGQCLNCVCIVKPRKNFSNYCISTFNSQKSGYAADNTAYIQLVHDFCLRSWLYDRR